MANDAVRNACAFHGGQGGLFAHHSKSAAR
jgi:hypothetical protein